MKVCLKCQEEFTDKFTKCIYCGGPLETVPSRRKGVPAEEDRGVPLAADLKKKWKNIRVTAMTMFILALGAVFVVSQLVDFKKEDPQKPEAASVKIDAPIEPVFVNAPVARTDLSPAPDKDSPNEQAYGFLKEAFTLCEGGKCTDAKKAIDLLDKAIELNPDYAEAYNNRGNAYADLKQYERAIEDYNEVIRLQPRFAYAYYNRALTYTDMEMPQRAIEDYNEVIRLKPDDANAYHNRGHANFMLDNKDLGCSDAQKACELGNCKLLENARKKKDCPS